METIYLHIMCAFQVGVADNTLKKDTLEGANAIVGCQLNAEAFAVT